MATDKTKPAANSKKTAPGKPFEPGKSGNPSGRPKLDPKWVELCRTHAPDKLINMLDKWDSLNEKTQTHLIELMAGYAYGKPTQSIEASGTDGKPISFVVIAAPKQE